MRTNYNKKAVLIVLVILAVSIISVIVIQEHRTPAVILSGDAIKSLPYLAWTPAGKSITKEGVLTYDRTKAYPGFNVFTSDPLSSSVIIDMEGNQLHAWLFGQIGLQDLTLSKNGDVVALFQNTMLCLLDWDSRVKWKRRMWVHHDAAVGQNGDIYVLVNRREWVLRYGLPFPITNDYLVLLSGQGLFKKEISLYDKLKQDIEFRSLVTIYRWMVKPEQPQARIPRGQNAYPKSPWPLDVIHANSVKIIGQDIDGLCSKGDILLSSCRLNLIMILDSKTEEVTWRWGQRELQCPHDPTLLENGNILVFDNGARRGYSRIVELDPLTKGIVWEYKAAEPNDFFSRTRGAAQRLPNGNTLITATDQGRAFEVTPGGQIVWEFYNPGINQDAGTRAVINRMERVFDIENYPHLKAIAEKRESSR